MYNKSLNFEVRISMLLLLPSIKQAPFNGPFLKRANPTKYAGHVLPARCPICDLAFYPTPHLRHLAISTAETKQTLIFFSHFAKLFSSTEPHSKSHFERGLRFCARSIELLYSAQSSFFSGGVLCWNFEGIRVLCIIFSWFDFPMLWGSQFVQQSNGPEPQKRFQ